MHGGWGATDALMVFDKFVRRCLVGDNGRAEAGPYRTLRPAEAGAGRYRCPAYKLPDEKVKDQKLVPPFTWAKALEVCPAWQAGQRERPAPASAGRRRW